MERRNSWCGWTVVAAALGAVACTAPHGASTPVAAPAMTNAWIDVTATLDPSTTPVYEGDAPMRFEFLKDMRKGDALTLSA